MAWVIIGLGNPGEEYENTRHNAGRMALEYVRKANDLTPLKELPKYKTQSTSGMIGKALVALVAPDTYMNKSGSAVVKYVKTAKAAEKMIVLYDDLDLPLGSMKISFDRGSGGHRGLESVIRSVKTKRFTRVRIGVSPITPGGKLKKPHGEKEVLDFILAKYKPVEMETLKKVFKKVSEVVEVIVTEGTAVAMNKSN